MYCHGWVESGVQLPVWVIFSQKVNISENLSFNVQIDHVISMEMTTTMSIVVGQCLGIITICREMSID